MSIPLLGGIRILTPDPQYNQYHQLSTYYVLTQLLKTLLNYLILIPNLLLFSQPVGWVYVIINPYLEENGGQRTPHIKVGMAFNANWHYVRSRIQSYGATMNGGVHFAVRCLWPWHTEKMLKEILKTSGLTRVHSHRGEEYKGSVPLATNTARVMIEVLRALHLSAQHPRLDSIPGRDIVQDRINVPWYSLARESLMLLKIHRLHKTFLPQGYKPEQLTPVGKWVHFWYGLGGDRERTTSFAQPAGQPGPLDIIESLRTSLTNGTDMVDARTLFTAEADTWMGQQFDANVVKRDPYSTDFIQDLHLHSTTEWFESFNNHHVVWAILYWFIVFVILVSAWVYIGFWKMVLCIFVFHALILFVKVSILKCKRA